MVFSFSIRKNRLIYKRNAKWNFYAGLRSKTITCEQLAKVIDNSLLRPELTEADVIAGFQLAVRYHTATICVKPCHVKLAKELLKDSYVVVSTMVGFPNGSNLTEIKVAAFELWLEF